MHKSRRLVVLLLVTLVAAGWAGGQAQQGLAETNGTPAPRFLPLPEQFRAPLGESAEAEEVNVQFNAAPTASRTLPEFRLDPTTLPTAAPALMAPAAAQEEVCGQLLVNPKLDVVIIGENIGTAEPWVPLIQNIYYDDQLFHSAQYSLVMVIGDNDDATPEVDAFGQAFFTPDKLTRVFIEYFVTLEFANSIDEVYGEIYAVDPNTGDLTQLLGQWQIDDNPVPPAPPNWQRQYLDLTDPGILTSLQDKLLAIVFSNFTTDTSPGEIVRFDDIQIIACIQRAPKALYLPVIRKQPAGAVCIPPTENPRDTLTANRGSVETNATCQSSLSTVDREDYYSFRTGSSGNYTFNLRNLPPNTEWSLDLVILEPRGFAPGPTNGQCRIATPGSGNKSITCNLASNKDYVVRVLGDGNSGNYTMRITR